jgi:DNA adenine methylase
MSETRIPKKPALSPLRYPGGKSALYPQLREILQSNNLIDATYVEPYAGGAGAGVALLITGQIERLVINDLDPAIYSFWKTLTENPEGFAQKIEEVELTVAEWDRQKAIYARKDQDNYGNLGFATFFLNRTNRSGVLNGGIIGGRSQEGPFKIDARFPRKALIERIRLIGLYSDRITVRNTDGIEIIAEFATQPNTLIYADPPYFEKAGSLYMNSFRMENHELLASCLNANAQGNWVLTYDDVPDVHRLYSARKRTNIDLNYSAHRVKKATEIMVFADSIHRSGLN